MDKFSNWHNKLTKDAISQLKLNRVGCYYTYRTTQIVNQDIFTLLDSPAFLLQISGIRKKLGITKVPFSDYYTLVKRIEVKRDPPFGNNISSQEFASVLTVRYYWHKILDLWHPPKHPKRRLLELESIELLFKLDKPPYLIEVVMQALLLNQIGWDSVIHKTLNTDNYYPLPEIMPTHAILVNPRTTYTEIKLAIKEISEGNYRHNAYGKLPKYMPNFMTYSRWYWERIDGKSYSQIAKDWNDQTGQVNVGENDVSRKVNKYAKLLSF